MEEPKSPKPQSSSRGGDVGGAVGFAGAGAGEEVVKPRRSSKPDDALEAGAGDGLLLAARASKPAHADAV